MEIGKFVIPSPHDSWPPMNFWIYWCHVAQIQPSDQAMKFDFAWFWVNTLTHTTDAYLHGSGIIHDYLHSRIRVIYVISILKTRPGYNCTLGNPLLACADLCTLGAPLLTCTNINHNMGVPGSATDCPCGVWCRGLTTCPLYVGPLAPCMLVHFLEI